MRTAESYEPLRSSVCERARNKARLGWRCQSPADRLDAEGRADRLDLKGAKARPAEIAVCTSWRGTFAHFPACSRKEPRPEGAMIGAPRLPRQALSRTKTDEFPPVSTGPSEALPGLATPGRTCARG